MRTTATKTDDIAQRPLGLRRRPDLLIQPQRYGPEQYWLVKDPVAARYFHLAAEEHAILSMLDGRTISSAPPPPLPWEPDPWPDPSPDQSPRGGLPPDVEGCALLTVLLVEDPCFRSALDSDFFRLRASLYARTTGSVPEKPVAKTIRRRRRV